MSSSELRKVIFSHIGDAEQLGKESLDELIEYKTEELNAQLAAQRQEVSALNVELVKLEAKATADHAAQLDAKLKLKQQELNAHEANKPAAVEKPNNLTAEQQEANAQIAGEIEKERAELAGVETQITEKRARLKTLTEHIALSKKLEGKLDNFEAEFARLQQECAADFDKLSLNMGTIVTVTVNKTPLREKRQSLSAEKGTIDASLSPIEEKSLLSQKVACEGRIKALKDKLDAPNKRYQAYQEALKAWQQQKDAIVGNADKPDTIKYYEAQIKYTTEELPKKISDIKEQRREATRKVHASIAAVKDVYVELFLPVSN